MTTSGILLAVLFCLPPDRRAAGRHPQLIKASQRPAALSLRVSEPPGRTAHNPENDDIDAVRTN